MPAKNREHQKAMFAKLGEKRAKELGFDRIEGKGGKHKKRKK